MYLICEYTKNIKRAESGSVGYRPSNSEKQFLDKMPQTDDKGNEITNIWIVYVGRYSGYRCISQWNLSKLAEDEKVNLELEPDRSISIRNSSGKKIGYYPSQGINYEELQLRLEQKQKVIAAVRNWGLELSNAFHCGIAIHVYGEVPAV